MKDRFSPDLFVVVLGPMLGSLTVVGLGRVIFHAEQLRGSMAAYGVAIATTVVVFSIACLCRLWS